MMNKFMDILLAPPIKVKRGEAYNIKFQKSKFAITTNGGMRKWYEPAQAFVWFENGYYYDDNHNVLIDPMDYNFDNGFYQLNE